MVFFLLAWSFNSPFDQSAMNLVHHTLFYLFAPPYSLFLLGKGRKHSHSFKEMECMWQSSKFCKGASGRKKIFVWGEGGSKAIFANFTEFIRFFPLDPSSFIIHDTLCNFFFTVIYHMSYLNNLNWGFFWHFHKSVRRSISSCLISLSLSLSLSLQSTFFYL